MVYYNRICNSILAIFIFILISPFVTAVPIIACDDWSDYYDYLAENEPTFSVSSEFSVEVGKGIRDLDLNRDYDYIIWSNHSGIESALIMPYVSSWPTMSCTDGLHSGDIGRSPYPPLEKQIECRLDMFFIGDNNESIDFLHSIDIKYGCYDWMPVYLPSKAEVFEKGHNILHLNGTIFIDDPFYAAYYNNCTHPTIYTSFRMQIYNYTEGIAIEEYYSNTEPVVEFINLKIWIYLRPESNSRLFESGYTKSCIHLFYENGRPDISVGHEPIVNTTLATIFLAFFLSLFFSRKDE